jgi:hypothetical protein
MKILILGGYGTFGGRVAQLLSHESPLTLVIAGRSASKAERFISRLPPGARKTPLALDRDTGIDAAIGALQPDLVVDATGPFQAYGDDPYRVVKACIAARASYVDLADDPAFVESIAQFDAQARERNLHVLSGVSSFPVLTAAVVRRLSRDFAHVTEIAGGVAPSPYADVGLNVIRAIASYAGKAVPCVDRGRTGGFAFAQSHRFTIRPPGSLPLRNKRFSLVDVPDLRVLPRIWPGLQSLWMGASPAPEALH